MNEHKSRKTAPFDIRVDKDLTHPQVFALLREHLAGMHAESPSDKVYALDLSGLRQPNITFLTAWRVRPDQGRTGAQQQADEFEEDELMACGAIKELDPHHGEIKSMRTAARHLRQGAAKTILTELLAIARQRSYARASLETGTTPGFEAAVAMYRRFGFVESGPFADYPVDPFSRFMTQVLAET
jgi:putative acetyltransferase